MELQCELLVYLDQNGYLLDMNEKCSEFLKTLVKNTMKKFPPLRYLIKIDLMDLFEKCPSLGSFLVEEPIKFRNMIQDIVFACLRSLENSDTSLGMVQHSQINILLRLECVSELLVPPNRPDHSGLFSFKGYLTEVSKPVDYPFHTVWSCSEECEASKVILYFFPERVPKCSICKGTLFENSNLRRCGEQVKATFVTEDRSLPRIIPIADDLISKLKLGSSQYVTGVVLKNKMHIFSVEPLGTLTAPSTAVFPANIDMLFKMFEAVPWNFIYSIASIIGVNVIPQSCFMHLKICLLMSLMSVKNVASHRSNLIHVLAFGSDSDHVGPLMAEAAKLTDRSIFLGNDQNTSVATALLASSGGVCLMPLPLFTYNQKHTNIILSAIESNKISTQNGPIKLNSAIWSQTTSFKKLSLFNTVNGLGMLLCEADCGEDNDEIVEFMLKYSFEVPQIAEIKQAYKDIKLYLDLLAGIDVSLSYKAEEILRAYFVGVRKINAENIGLGAMGILVSTCTASAKLCHRDVASVEDAIFSIWLHAAGTPGDKVAQNKYFKIPRDIDIFHEMMLEFKIWLNDFTGIEF